MCILTRKATSEGFEEERSGVGPVSSGHAVSFSHFTSQIWPFHIQLTGEIKRPELTLIAFTSLGGNIRAGKVYFLPACSFHVLFQGRIPVTIPGPAQ